MIPLPTITCDGCGRCCDRVGTPPFMLLGDDRPPPGLEIGPEHDDRYDRGLPCLWFDSDAKTCRHYDHRPAVCREFAVGGPDCLEMRGSP